MTLPTKLVQLSPKEITLAGESDPIPNPFTGSIGLRLPTYIERMDIIEELSKPKDGDTEISTTKRLLKAAIDRIETVDVTHTETGTKITDVQELCFYSEGAALLNEISKTLTMGATLGKS
jgi:hypothetical protein